LEESSASTIISTSSDVFNVATILYVVVFQISRDDDDDAAADEVLSHVIYFLLDNSFNFQLFLLIYIDHFGRFQYGKERDSDLVGALMD
jgi:hypothetical protein